MFIDASALVSLLTDEDEARELLARMQSDPRRLTSPAALWETTVSVARVLAMSIKDVAAAVDEYLTLTAIEVRPIPVEASALAIDAFDRYGKGRHRARLNFGDCFSYACARYYDEPLLYKGGDFSYTDIQSA